MAKKVSTVDYENDFERVLTGILDQVVGLHHGGERRCRDPWYCLRERVQRHQRKEWPDGGINVEGTLGLAAICVLLRQRLAEAALTRSPDGG
jgi:hypothetical protein